MMVLVRMQTRQRGFPLVAAVALLMSVCGALPVGAQSLTIQIPATAPAADAWQALEAGRLQEAAAAFDRALAASPQNVMLQLGAGVVAERLGQTAKARDALGRALAIDPGFTLASQLLGEFAYQAGDLAEAIRVYEAALAKAPGQARLAARLEQWRKEAALHDGFLQAQGSHFTVLFEGPAEEELARRAVDVLESAYARVGTALFTYPVDVITVVLYTQEQFRDITRSPGWSAGLYDGRIRVPVRGALKDPRELERVLTHEFTHALIHSVAPTGVPTWLNEGLAVVFEPRGLEGARRELAAAPALVPLSALHGSFESLSTEQMKAAYAESALAVQAMIGMAFPAGTAASAARISRASS
jgi:tetratricopeptide (TPR) repeat protein